MDFLLSDDLKEFAVSLQKFLSTTFGSKELRARLLSDSGPLPASDADLTHWNALAELGALSASISEDSGGLGFGVLAAQAITELGGRVLCPLPLTETLMSIALLEILGTSEAKADLLPRIAGGELIAVAAVQELIERDALREVALTISSSENQGRYTVSGTANFVPHASTSGLLLVPALHGGKRALFAVEVSGAETQFEILPTFDLIRPYYRVSFKNSSARLVSNQELASSVWSEACAVASLLAAAEMIGAATTAFQMSLDYAKTREQFGQPIARFQAISHKLSNMYVELEAATSLNRFAAHCATNDRAQLILSAAASKGLASETLPLLVQEAIQVHGGIGFTFEYDLHLYLRRVRVLSSLYGSAKSFFRRTAEIVMAQEQTL